MTTLQVTALLAAAFALPASAKNIKTPTPLMGWNSYNAYGCDNPGPTLDILKSNAQGLIDTGLAKLGYVYVTPDCGWDAPGRDSQGRQIWNSTRFPGGGEALGKT